MRVATMAAGLVLVLTACGGEKKAETPAATPAAAPAAEAPAAAATTPGATGATLDVKMVLEGTAYKYVPESFTVKAGDVVRFHNTSGGPHNVAFVAGKIPAGTEAVIDAALGANRMGPLTGALLVEQDAIFTLNTTGFPAGKYGLTCTPHSALGMHGEMIVN